MLSKVWQGRYAAAFGQALARGAHGGEGEGLGEESEGEGDDEGDEGAGSREERMQVLKGAVERLPHCLAEVCRKSLPSLMKEPYDDLQKETYSRLCCAQLKGVYAAPETRLAAPTNPLEAAAPSARSLAAGGAGGDAAAVCGEGGKDETPDGAGEGGVAVEDALVDEGGKANQEPAARACRRGSSGVYATGAGEGGMAICAQPGAGRV